MPSLYRRLLLYGYLTKLPNSHILFGELAKQPNESLFGELTKYPKKPSFDRRFDPQYRIRIQKSNVVALECVVGLATGVREGAGIDIPLPRNMGGFRNWPLAVHT